MLNFSISPSYQAYCIWKNPQFLRIAFGQFSTNLVRICLHEFRSFAAMWNIGISLWWEHRELDAPDNNKKVQYKDCEVRQELYRSTQYEKPRQDVGVFSFLKLIHIVTIIFHCKKVFFEVILLIFFKLSSNYGSYISRYSYRINF